MKELDIKRLIGITEPHELPPKLMSIVLDKKQREEVFREFLDCGVDLSYDFFRDFFEQQSSNRKDLMQDYTPDCICQILRQIIPKTDKVLDICSGTGSLSLAGYSEQNYQIYCEEYSTAVLPILLFNLAIRGIEGVVKHRDVITQRTFHTYKLTKDGQFSNIKEVDHLDDEKFDVVVSNPPYSMQWTPIEDERFEGYDLAPKKAADYAFVLDGISRLSDTGKAFYILPVGVLFRGNAEEKIRKALIQNNLLEAVISLPGKLFANTDIPVCIIVFSKCKKTNNIFIVNAADDFIKLKSNNSMSAAQISLVVDTYLRRLEIKDYSRSVTLKEVENNSYNLNIPRYVYHCERHDDIDLQTVMQDVIRTEQEMCEIENQLVEMIKVLRGTDADRDNYYVTCIQPYIDWINSRGGGT